MARTYVTLPLALAAILLVAGCPGLLGTGAGGSSTGGTVTGGASGTSTIASDAERILQLVNAERTSRGLSSLAANTLLDAAAATHATDMAGNNFFAHTGSDGSSVSDRATAAGYVWTKIGENIGLGNVSADDMMDLWMNSTEHRANILDPDFTELGVATDDSGTKLWVQVFGRP
jgi:uncharacterized protein YkwD